VPREVTDTALSDEIAGSLFQDHRGRIWVSTIPRLVYFENKHFVALSHTACGDFVHSMADDGAGDVWVSANQFLCHLRDQSVMEQIPWTSLGAKDFAETLRADPMLGGLWLGFFKGGIAYFKDDQVSASYTTVDGLTRWTRQ
jgi:ligand-binding sensor domain-containing protein